MPTERRERQNYQERFSDTGHYYFSLTQVDIRFSLCKESLLFEHGIYLYFKKVYRSLRDIEECAVLRGDNKRKLRERYRSLEDLGFGGKFKKYDKEYCPEGAMFPFVRARGRRKLDILDTGCIWLGTRFEYPLVYVDNGVADWVSCYSQTGRVRKDPFRPYYQVVDLVPKLCDKEKYPDLNVDLLL